MTTYERLDLLRTQIRVELEETELELMYLENPNGRFIEMIIEKQFYGRRINDEKSVDFECKYPKNWWNHFKEDVFPKWLKKRFPVEYKTIKERKTVKFTRDYDFGKINTPFVIRDYEPRFISEDEFK